MITVIVDIRKEKIIIYIAIIMAIHITISAAVWYIGLQRNQSQMDKNKKYYVKAGQ